MAADKDTQNEPKGKKHISRLDMLKLGIIGAASLAVAPLVAACGNAATQPISTNTPTAQNQEVEKEYLRAVDGEKMWVLLNHVKPDRRKEFERFMHQIIKQIGARSEPHVLNRTRILHPTGPNEDGTYTYIFLMDPVVQDGEYSFEKLLSLAYSPEEAGELIKLFNESLASGQVAYEVTQTAW
jgi:hypothetical protein